MKKTLFDKIWDAHVLTGEVGDPQLLYIDLHLVHEVTSPQGFEGLREHGRGVHRPDKTIATVDHNVPTEDVFNIKDLIAKTQIEALQTNTQEFGIPLMDIADDDQGIIHMVGPEQGASQPGKTIVCGDSHTATHGAFGAIAFGIGSSEVEHVLATQALWQEKPKTLGIKVTGELQPGVYAKDIILHIISQYGASYGTGYALEFYGDTIDQLSMEGRMTIANMAIEFGAKFGMMAPDQKTYDYLKGRPYAPKRFDEAVAYWETLYTDEGAEYDKHIEIDVTDLAPYITWGTNPGMGVAYDDVLPEIKDHNDQRAYEYMGLEPGMKPADIPVEYIFIGSCTNARLEDLAEGVKYIKGRKIPEHVQAMVVPGSNQVKREAERLGIAQKYIEAGFEWREPGCSACLGMNPDQFPSGKHVISTSNRNFEGRQGPGARTHLVSPATAVLAGVTGKVMDARKEAVNN